MNNEEWRLSVFGSGTLVKTIERKNINCKEMALMMRNSDFFLSGN